MSAIDWIRRRLSGQDGFTLIEVLVAAFILVLGSLAIFMTFAAAIHNVQRSRDAQIAQSIAQREMEKIQSLPYVRIAMSGLPETSTVSASPANRVSGEEFALNRNRTEFAKLSIASVGTCTPENLCVNSKPASSCVGGSGTTFTNGTAKGSVYCYVTNRSDAACETATGKFCPYKRIVVAVWLEKAANQASRRSYYELQGTVNESS
jgi:prepilin-type N-terminal cleavage/methylation domain-containing protein